MLEYRTCHDDIRAFIFQGQDIGVLQDDIDALGFLEIETRIGKLLGRDLPERAIDILAADFRNGFCVVYIVARLRLRHNRRKTPCRFPLLKDAWVYSS
jgi:hypothetical protein